MTLSAFAYTLTPGRRYSFGCRHRLGTASNLAMYVSARQRLRGHRSACGATFSRVPAVVSSDAAGFFRSVKKFRMATHVLERREQLRPVLKAAVDAEALKRGASREEVSRLHDELARGAPVLLPMGSLAGSRRRRSTS